MPFQVDYTGPAPVESYFVLHPLRDNSFQTKKDASKFDAEINMEAISSFRGRHIQGTRKLLPMGYKLGFFQMAEDAQESEAQRRPKHIQPRSPAVAASVQTKKILLNDDDDDISGLGEECDDFAHYQAPEYTPGYAADQDASINTAIVHKLYPLYNAATSFWAWGSDGPVDQGGHPFLRTWHEWVETIAPAVRPHHNLTQQIHCTE